MRSTEVFRSAALLCLCLCLLVPREGRASTSAAIFTKKCQSCHSFGKGDRIGPDLKGVTDRHDRRWLTAWIRSPEAMLRSGDRTATLLFDKYKPERMPDQNLSAAEIAALLDYLEARGPEADAPHAPRRVETATAAEIALGADLFFGRTRLANGDLSCIACHSLESDRAGGSLACDLTHVYSRFQDRGLSSFLRSRCFPRPAEGEPERDRTEQEIFALKAFLHHMDSRPGASPVASASLTGSHADWISGQSGGHPFARSRDYFLFAIAPYLAGVWFISISLVRYVRSRKDGARSVERSKATARFPGAAAWGYGVALLVLAHLLPVLLPEHMLSSRASLRLVADGTMLVSGGFVLVCVVAIIRRHLFTAADRADASPADASTLTLLLLAAVSGIGVAVLYRWASSWSALTLTPYLLSLATLNPRVDLVADMPLLVRLHIFAAFAVAAAIPFTRLAYWVIAPVDPLLGYVVPPVAALYCAWRNALAEWGARQAAAVATWVWQEEEN